MSDSTIDQQFIEYVVKTLVEKPEEVSIERTIDEKGVLLLLTVDPEDLGRVIGKRGATAQSMRTLLRALGTKNESRYNLKIVDNGYPKPGRDDSSRSDDADDSLSSDDVSDDSAEDKKPECMRKPAKPGSDDSEDAGGFESSGFATDEPAETTADEPEESAVERTRRELEDLDDLDI